MPANHVLPLLATQKIQTMLAGLTPAASEFPSDLARPDARSCEDLTDAAASRRLRAANPGYLAEARRQSHKLLCLIRDPKDAFIRYTASFE
jgi:hypothetical protein